MAQDLRTPSRKLADELSIAIAERITEFLPEELDNVENIGATALVDVLASWLHWHSDCQDALVLAVEGSSQALMDYAMQRWSAEAMGAFPLGKIRA